MPRKIIFGSGYIGAALLEYWSSKKKNLTATTTTKEKLPSLEKLANKVFLAKGADPLSTKQALTSGEQLIIAVAPKSGESYTDTYFQTAKTICSALANNSNIKHLVYLSSTSVYEEQNGAWVTEDTPVNPKLENSKILYNTENLYLQKTPSNTLVTILRLGGIYGPNRSHASRVKRLATASLPGNGRAFCNWVHQEDIIKAIDWVLKEKLSGIYNICSDDHPTKKDFYNTITQEMNLPNILWDSKKKGPQRGNQRVSNNKIRETGFTFLYSCFGPIK